MPASEAALDEAAELVADDDACCPPHPATHSAAQTTSMALSNNVSVLFLVSGDGFLDGDLVDNTSVDRFVTNLIGHNGFIGCDDV